MSRARTRRDELLARGFVPREPQNLSVQSDAIAPWARLSSRVDINKATRFFWRLLVGLVQRRAVISCVDELGYGFVGLSGVRSVGVGK